MWTKSVIFIDTYEYKTLFEKLFFSYFFVVVFSSQPNENKSAIIDLRTKPLPSLNHMLCKWPFWTYRDLGKVIFQYSESFGNYSVKHNFVRKGGVRFFTEYGHIGHQMKGLD